MFNSIYPYLKTALSFTANLSTTGALYQTSKRAEQEVSKYVINENASLILEYGAGHGNITKSILAKMGEHDRLFALEVNAEFCDVLNKIDDKRLTIINDAAQNIDHYVAEKVDCIISTIPISLIPNPIVSEILAKSYQLLKTDGAMSQILYSTYHLSKFKKLFSEVSYRTLLGLPIEFVYHCKK